MRIESEVTWDKALDDVGGYPSRLMEAAATSVIEKLAGTVKPGRDYIVSAYEEKAFDESRFCFRYDFGLDVADAVRCRDCIAYSLLRDPDGDRPKCPWCELLEVKTMPDGFCHRGRRMHATENQEA